MPAYKVVLNWTARKEVYIEAASADAAESLARNVTDTTGEYEMGNFSVCSIRAVSEHDLSYLDVIYRTPRKPRE